MIRYTQLFGEVVMEATQKSWTKTTLLMLVGWENCWSVYYRSESRSGGAVRVELLMK